MSAEVNWAIYSATKIAKQKNKLQGLWIIPIFQGFRYFAALQSLHFDGRAKDIVIKE